MRWRWWWWLRCGGRGGPIHSGGWVDARADERWVGRASGRVVFEGLALIQVKWQWRRLYDDEEHLGDREACNFLARSLARSTRRTCTAAVHNRPSMHARISSSSTSSSAILRHSTSRTTAVPRDRFVFGRGIAVMRLR